jgi:hypothetical protein
MMRAMAVKCDRIMTSLTMVALGKTLLPGKIILLSTAHVTYYQRYCMCVCACVPVYGSCLWINASYMNISFVTSIYARSRNCFVMSRQSLRMGQIVFYLWVNTKAQTLKK